MTDQSSKGSTLLTQFLYFAVFDPPHRGHLARIEAVRSRWAPSSTQIVPLDPYDGAIPGRRIVRTRLVAALAEAADATYTDAGLANWDLKALLVRLAARAQRTLILFDPELPRRFTIGSIDAGRASVEFIADAALALPGGLPSHASLLSSIRLDDEEWRSQVVAGAAPLIEALGLYGWAKPPRR